MLRRTFLALLVFPAQALAHATKLGSIAIGHAWALPTSGPDGNVFFPLVNNGTARDELVAARSDVCERVELRDNDRYDDPPLAAIVLDPGKPVPMRPTARHLRLAGLTKPLEEYRNFKMTLVFLKVGEVEIEVIVEASASD